LILPERCGNDGQKLGNFKGNHTERMPKQKPESLNVIRGANLSSYNFHYRRPKSFLHTLKAPAPPG
jgi:hypothetical protein